jgi:Flp pilus assembly protein TadG
MNREGATTTKRPPRRRRSWNRGQSAAELAAITPVLVLLLIAASDFGRMYYVSVAVNNAARAGAQYGSQSVATAADSSGMVSEAKTDGSNISGLTANASQCTCASGSSVAACPASYCTHNAQATYVEVDTQAVFNTVMKYPGVASSVTLTGKAIMQVQE